MTGVTQRPGLRAVASVARMAPYALAGALPSGTVPLAQNESAFSASPQALAAGQAALAQAAEYPDPDWTDLRAAIAQVHGLDPGLLLCGAGSMELIGALIRAFAGPGDQVLSPEYGYLFTDTAAAQAGADAVRVAERAFTVCIDTLLGAVTPQTRIVFVCNPGNPTGTRIANAQILRLRDGLPPDVVLAVDQAYGEFDDQPAGPVFDLVAGGNTVVFRTLSKAYGLAAARCGWCAAPPAIGTEMRKLLNPNNVTGVSQAMCAAALRDQPHMLAIAAQTAKLRADLSAQLSAAGFAVPQSHTNFVLVGFGTAAAAQSADAALRRAGLMVRGMGGYGLPAHLRITIGTAPVMQQVARTLLSWKETYHAE